MSTKKELKKQISTVLLHDNRDRKLETIYLQALKESNIVGESISSIVYELLESIEESCQKKEIEETELHLCHALAVILKNIYEEAERNIQEKEKKLLHSHMEFIDTLEEEMERLLDSFDACYDYAHNQPYVKLQQTLFHLKLDILFKVNELKVLHLQYTQ